VLSAVVLLGLIGWFGWLQAVESRLDSVSSPERALALVVSRTMDLNEAVTRLPAWERRFYQLSLTEGASDLAQAIAWYEELVGRSDDPGVRVQLAILEGEAGRLSRVRERADEWESEEAPLPAFAPLIRTAYLESPRASETATEPPDELSEMLPNGWFHDRLVIRLATHAGDHGRLVATRLAQAARIDPLVRAIRRFAVVEVLVLVAGLLAVVTLVVRVRRDPAAVRIGTAAVPPPWCGQDGAVVLIRGGAAGVVLMAAFTLGPGLFNVDHPMLDMIVVAVVGLPLILLARRHLLAPAGQGVCQGFGLWPAPGRWGWLALSAVALIGVGMFTDLVLSLAGEWAGMPAHWTEWFDEDLVWGTRVDVASALVSAVMVAPVLEELTFRGLLYGTLRLRLSWVASAGVSGALFALAHGYGIAGFVSVFLSGVLWAWAYERTGSLLPGILAHATNNVAASLALLWILR